MMQNLLGKNGIELSHRSNGIDETPVIPYHEQVSISTEQTFQQDTIDMNFLNSELVRMTEKIAFELRQQNKVTGCVAVKLRYSNFETYTRQISIPYTNADHLLLKIAKELFKKLFERRMLIRLVGIRFTDLIPGTYQINLFDDTQQAIKLYQAIDSVKKQYGEKFLIHAAGITEIKSYKTVTNKSFRAYRT
jgi:DNA polymerase-4